MTEYKHDVIETDDQRVKVYRTTHTSKRLSIDVVREDGAVDCITLNIDEVDALREILELMLEVRPDPFAQLRQTRDVLKDMLVKRIGDEARVIVNAQIAAIEKLLGDDEGSEAVS